MMNIIVRQPETKAEWNQYYHLRWRILRQPWNQSPGSEKDELEDESIHRVAVDKINPEQIIAVGRLHCIQNNNAQIRYMAVDENFQRQGIGQQILLSLEQAAKQKKITSIELNARESAVAFYQANKYKLISSAHLLYGTIKHFNMKKTLSY